MYCLNALNVTECCVLLCVQWVSDAATPDEASYSNDGCYNLVIIACLRYLNLLICSFSWRRMMNIRVLVAVLLCRLQNLFLHTICHILSGFVLLVCFTLVQLSAALLCVLLGNLIFSLNFFKQMAGSFDGAHPDL